MKRVLAIHDLDLAERIVTALRAQGVEPETIEEEDEGGLSLWCIDVGEEDFPSAASVVDREMALDWENKATFRCERCVCAMQFKEDATRDPQVLEYECPQCGAIQAVTFG